MAEDSAQETQQRSLVSEEAVEVALLAHLDVHPGARFFTRGPQPCAVEYSAVPGERRGRVATGTEVVVLEAITHTLYGYRYVAARIASTYGDGDGWINLCREDQRFVVPVSEPRPGSNNVVADGDDASADRDGSSRRSAPGARANPY